MNIGSWVFESGNLVGGGKLDPWLAKIWAVGISLQHLWGGARPGQALPLVTPGLFAVVAVLLWLPVVLLPPLPCVFRLVGSRGEVGPERDDHASHVVTSCTVARGVWGQTLPQKLQGEERAAS